MPKGASRSSSSASASPSSSPATTASTRSVGTRSSGARTAAACATKAARKASTCVARDRAARRGAVPAVAQQVLGARVEPAEQVEGRDRAPRAGPLVAVQREHHARAVVALGDPGGDDADDPGVPALAGEHVGGLLAELAHLGLGLEEDPRLGVAALGVGVVELVGDRRGALGVVGEHELEPGVGAVQAPGGVDARGEAKADRARVERARVDLGHAQQRADPGLASTWPARAGPRARGGGSRRAAGRSRPRWRGRRGRGPRRRRRDRARRPPAARRRACRRRRRRTGRGTGSRRRRGARSARRAATPSARGLWWSVTTTSSPSRARQRDLVDRGDRAVGSEQQARAALGEPLHRRRAQPVAVLGAAGQVPVHVGAERAQHAHEDGGRADAVDVVVAVHRDARARAHVREDQRDGGVDPGEGRGVVALAAAASHARAAVLLPQPAAHEDLREREAHAEPALERAHRRDRCGRDVQEALHGRRTLGATADGTGAVGGPSRRGGQDLPMGRRKPRPRRASVHRHGRHPRRSRLAHHRRPPAARPAA